MMQRSGKRSFPESYFHEVEQEIAKMDLRPTLKQAILDNVRRHLERLANEQKDPVAVFGPPGHVAAQVRRQLQERRRQWRLRLSAWFLLFWGWALTLHGLYGMMQHELVWVTVAQLVYLVVGPLLLLVLLQGMLVINDWPQERRRWAFVGLAVGGTVMALGAVGWSMTYGEDSLQKPLFGMTPWLSVAVGAFVVLVGYRLLRHNR